MFDPDEGFFEKKEWRVPVTSLLTGTIKKWKVCNGEWVQQGDTVCIIKPDVPGAREDFEVPAPVSGRLGIESRFRETGTFVRGRTWGEETDIIAYVYTDVGI